MYDRKTWVILGLCGVLLAVNLYYSGQTQKAQAAARARETVEKQSTAAIEEATNTTTAALTL